MLISFGIEFIPLYVRIASVFDVSFLWHFILLKPWMELLGANEIVGPARFLMLLMELKHKNVYAELIVVWLRVFSR